MVTKKYSKDGKPLTGFTIIEVALSIFILTVAVVGIYSAFSLAVILSSDAANRLTAAYLVQEGQEIVRNIRDTNWLQQKDWLKWLGQCQGGCQADYNDDALYGWADTHLHLNASNGFYFYGDGSDGTPTKFKRKIIITPLTNNAVLVKVEVSWDEKANLLYVRQTAGNCNTKYNCVEAEATLYNWY